LVGSVYLFSKTVSLINETVLENKKPINKLITLINSVPLLVSGLVSGYIFLYGIHLITPLDI